MNEWPEFYVSGKQLPKVFFEVQDFKAIDLILQAQ